MATVSSPSSAPDRSPGRAAPTGLPAPVEAVAGGLFGALSRLRGRRSFHPDGVGYEGTLRIGRPHPDLRGAPLLAQPGEHVVLGRFSRALGLPEPMPDLLGLAVRIVDAHGPQAHQDFLLVTSADGPVLHHLLLPGLGGFLRQTFSSILLYRVGGRLHLVGAAPHGSRGAPAVTTLDELDATARDGALRFALTLASPTGRWTPVGEMAFFDRLPDRTTERLAFTPWNTGGGIRPVGPLMGLRLAAYRGSQRGRGLDPSQIP